MDDAEAWCSHIFSIHLHLSIWSVSILCYNSKTCVSTYPSPSCIDNFLPNEIYLKDFERLKGISSRKMCFKFQTCSKLNKQIVDSAGYNPWTTRMFIIIRPTRLATGAGESLEVLDLWSFGGYDQLLNQGKVWLFEELDMNGFSVFFEKFPHTEMVLISVWLFFFVSFLSLDFDFIHSSRDIGHIFCCWTGFISCSFLKYDS